MPQGRRKIPFSTKQKKVQLQSKREKKKDTYHNEDEGSDQCFSSSIKNTLGESSSISTQVLRINEQPHLESGKNINRYHLFFKKESNEEIKIKKEEARKPIMQLPEEALEVSYEKIYKPGSHLDIPKRPPWEHGISKQKLEAMEERYFREYVDRIEKSFSTESLSYFELNLETWRQLWRVIEMSDILLLIADIRHPVLHFSSALYDQVVNELKKDVIFVLNKIDLVPPHVVLAWKNYFAEKFPKLHLICFSAFGGYKTAANKKGRRKGKLKMAAKGAKQLLNLCRNIVGEAVDLSAWELKIEEEMRLEDKDEEDEHNPLSEATLLQKDKDTGHFQSERYRGGTLTLGFVGHPNVGKSSLLNAIMGRKVVSISRTPGHTKHFQTIQLTKNLTLCDCPGLVFPSVVPKALQVLSGCYPIAQLREPFSVIRFMAERLSLSRVLKLRHPEQGGNYSDPDLLFSAYDICEAWALQRGFLTAKAGRPDTNRAANHMLRMALDGRTLCLKFYPPGYTYRKEYWSEHPDCMEIEKLQGRNPEESDEEIVPENSEDSSDGESEDYDTAKPANKFALLAEDE